MLTAQEARGEALHVIEKDERFIMLMQSVEAMLAESIKAGRMWGYVPYDDARMNSSILDYVREILQRAGYSVHNNGPAELCIAW